MARKRRSNAPVSLIHRLRFPKTRPTLERGAGKARRFRPPSTGRENHSMQRRHFMILLSSGWLIPHELWGEHHVISADPLEVEFDLASLQGQYTLLDDF